MTYKLIVTERADKLLDNIIYHLLYYLKSEQAARHLLDEMEKIYIRLRENPLQFPLSKDIYLASKGYHEVIIPQMEYIIVFCIMGDAVNIVGIFHQLENYQRKL